MDPKYPAPARRHRSPLATLLTTSLAVSLTACSTGGKEERPTSELVVSASHHMFGYGGSQGFTDFPVPKNLIGSDRGIYTMSENGTYTITRGNTTSAEVAYNLAEDLTLDVIVPLGNSAPTRFVGAYQQAKPGETQMYFFTDRYAPAASPVVGLFFGVQTVDTTKVTWNQLGDWYLFAHTVVFSSSTVLDPDRVGRSVAGELKITAATDNKGDVVVGSNGIESTGTTNMTFAGHLREGVAEDGSAVLDLDFVNGSTKESRTFQVGHADDVILGIDEDESTGESGIVAMVRRFTVPDVAAARTKLAGTFHFGMHTLFVAPKQSGVDAANGTLVLNDKGGWELSGVGSAGPTAGKFSYSGSYAFENVGTSTAPVYTNRLILTVDGTRETWYAAVIGKPAATSFDGLVLLDNQIESRAAGVSPELNFALAIRKPE